MLFVFAIVNPDRYLLYTVPKVIDFPQNNINVAGKTWYYAEYFMYVVSCFSLHLLFYRWNLDYFSDSVCYYTCRKHLPHFCWVPVPHRPWCPPPWGPGTPPSSWSCPCWGGRDVKTQSFTNNGFSFFQFFSKILVSLRSQSCCALLSSHSEGL